MAQHSIRAAECLAVLLLKIGLLSGRVDQAALQPTELQLVSVSRVLELKVCPTAPEVKPILNFYLFLVF